VYYPDGRSEVKKNYTGKNLKGRYDLRNLPLYITIILKMILQKSDVKGWTRSSCSGKGLLAKCCEQIIKIWFQKGG
jgi:hypothetical protein